MPSLLRRSFFKLAAAPLAVDAIAAAQTARDPQRPVILSGDGIHYGPAGYAALLSEITSKADFQGDTYLQTGVIHELETAMAAELGKEKAIFLPTGTLANHLAVRLLAGETRKALVQAESHLYRDEGDCAQLLSGLNLVPLGSGRATLTADEVAQAIDQAAGPPYPAPVGAISIESPVRRTQGKVFDFAEMKKVSDLARAKHIGMHLDGARMYIASGYTGIAPAQYAVLFDTVYVSLYKYFNAPFGAMLAGPAPLIARAETLRHQFGSLIYQGWESAAVALHHFNGFTERYENAVRNGEKLFQALEASGKFHIERVPSGTNISRLRLASGGPLDQLRDRLAATGIRLAGAKGSPEAMVMINETINRRPSDEIARAFVG